MAKSEPEASSSAPPSEATRDDAPPVPHEHDHVLARVLEQVALPDAHAAASEVLDRRDAPAGLGLRTARVRAVGPTTFVAVFRGGRELAVELDEGVDPELVRRAADAGDRVLVEEEAGETRIVGVVATRLPETLELRARKIVLEGEEEVVIRSGQAAMRLREDGDVELVGSRISTVSRGLFRLVGKMLRLN